MKKFLIFLATIFVLNAQEVNKDDVPAGQAKPEQLEVEAPDTVKKEEVKKEKKKKSPLRIKAADSSYNSKTGLGIFKRNVVVEDDTFYLECDEMHVFYAKATKNKKAGMEKIIALKNVKIRQHPNTAKADKAVYILEDNTITLTGTPEERPVVTGEDGQRMTADVFVVNRITGDVSGQNISIEAIPTEETSEEQK